MPVESAQHTVRPDTARKVKVINHGSQPHVEKYRDVEYKIPAGGHIYMDVIAANRFLSQWYPMKKIKANGTMVSQGKPLTIEELSPKEREQVEGVTPELQKKAEEEQNVKASLTCMKCGFVAVNTTGLKTHLADQHPGD